MPSETLLAHVALRFSSHPENLATECLEFILSRSPAARRALLNFIHHSLGIGFPDSASYRSQASGVEGSIPDLVATIDGKEVIIIESKFWAGLTDNQPVAYLARLSRGEAGLLLFVAPALRITSLWSEIVRRCHQANLVVGVERQPSPEVVMRAIDGHVCALASWRAFLAAMAGGLNTEGDMGTLSDVSQLRGLCDRMDDESFLPLRSEELTSSFGARLLQINRLVDDVVSRAVGENLASLDRCGTGSSDGSYKRYMILSGCGCSLQVNPRCWAQIRPTPIWLSVTGFDFAPLTEVAKKSLTKLRDEDPPRIILQGTELLIPLMLPVAVERHLVVDALFSQLKDIAILIGSSSAPT